MTFDWDESNSRVPIARKPRWGRSSKRISNLRKHGIDFVDVPAVFGGSIVTVEDDRFDYGEERFVTFGLLQGRVIAIVHTESEDYIRIISARKATKYEQKIYFEQI